MPESSSEAALPPEAAPGETPEERALRESAGAESLAGDSAAAEMPVVSPDVVRAQNLAARRALRVFAFVAAATIVIDQLSKAWIRSALPLGDEREIVPGLLSFSHILNYGAAWGMLSGQRFLLIGVTLVVMVMVSQMAREFAPHSVLARLGLGLILGGAIGNLIDRIAAGAVTDFIDLGTSISFIRTFPIFNLADSALTVGVVLLCIEVLFNRRPIVR